MKFRLSMLILLTTIVLQVNAQEIKYKTKLREEKQIALNSEKVKRIMLPSAFDKTDESTSQLPQTKPYIRPTKQQRFKRYLSDAFGVPALVGSVFGAGVSQITNNPPEWKRTTGGYGKRFVSNYGSNVIRNTVSYGLSEAFKLDNRFERSGQKNFGKRLKHVFVSSYTTRMSNGKRIPDFPYFVGTYSASIIANEAWMPDRFSYKDGLRSGTISLGTRFGVNLLREFIFRK